VISTLKNGNPVDAVLHGQVADMKTFAFVFERVEIFFAITALPYSCVPCKTWGPADDQADLTGQLFRFYLDSGFFLFFLS
jgi:hypothetical protein